MSATQQFVLDARLSEIYRAVPRILYPDGKQAPICHGMFFKVGRRVVLVAPTEAIRDAATGTVEFLALVVPCLRAEPDERDAVVSRKPCQSAVVGRGATSGLSAVSLKGYANVCLPRAFSLDLKIVTAPLSRAVAITPDYDDVLHGRPKGIDVNDVDSFEMFGAPVIDGDWSSGKLRCHGIVSGNSKFASIDAVRGLVLAAAPGGAR